MIRKLILIAIVSLCFAAEASGQPVPLMRTLLDTPSTDPAAANQYLKWNGSTWVYETSVALLKLDDDEVLTFGTDDDFSWVYSATDGTLQIVTGTTPGSNQLVHVDTNGEVTLVNIGVNSGLALGDGDSKIYEEIDDLVTIRVGGTDRWTLLADEFGSDNANGPAILNELTSGTNPTLIPNQSQPTTGIGAASTNEISLIASAIEVVNVDAAGLTASSGVDPLVEIATTYNQTLTAGSTDLLINRTETVLGSGSHLFLDLQVATVSKFSIDNTGAPTIGAYTLPIVDGSDGQQLTTDGLGVVTWGASGLWTDAGTVTHLTDLADDLAIGGTTNTAPLFFDESTAQLYVNNTSGSGLVVRNDVDTAQSFQVNINNAGHAAATIRTNTASREAVFSARDNIAGIEWTFGTASTTNDFFIGEKTAGSGVIGWNTSAFGIRNTSDQVGIGGTEPSDEKLLITGTDPTEKILHLVHAASEADDYIHVADSIGTEVFVIGSNERFQFNTASSSNTMNVGGDRVLNFIGGNASIKSNTGTMTYVGTTHTFNSGDIRINSDVDGAALNVKPKDTFEKALAIQQFTAGVDNLLKLEDAAGATVGEWAIDQMSIGTDLTAGVELEVYDATSTALFWLVSETGASTMRIYSNEDGLGGAASSIEFFDDSIRQWEIQKAGGNNFEITNEVTNNVAFRVDIDDDDVHLLMGGAGYVGVADGTPDAMIDIENHTATDVGFIVKGAAAQSADLFRATNNTDTSLVLINSAGEVNIKPSGSAGGAPIASSLNDLVVEGSGNAGITIAVPDANSGYLGFSSPSASSGGSNLIRWFYNAGSEFFAITVDSNEIARLTETTAAINGPTTVDQTSATGAVPVLNLDQVDIDDTFINFIGTSAADGTRSISSDTTEDSAKFGAIRIEINGVTKWIRVYDDES